jgi:hypothetical protein
MNTAEIFEPGDGAQYLALMKKARKTNAQRDRIDDGAGFLKPNEGAVDLQLRNAIAAIGCGLQISDWDCVAEGLDILQRTELQIRLIDRKVSA